MADTLWADVSEWQAAVNDSYPYQVLAIRSNDGTYRDKKFPANYAWATGALDAGRLRALIVYCVFRPNWQDTLNTMKTVVGTPHPKIVAMIDVESWGGQITGNQSDPINRLYWGLADWLGNPARVIGYGNTGDLNALWPNKPPGIRLIVAAYGSNPGYPGKLGHQFSDSYPTPPFGPCDINSADGYDIDAFSAAVGLTGTPTPPAPPPAPDPGPTVIPLMNYGETSDTVRHLQDFMNRVFPAYSHLPVTGLYGDQTTAVIREFQRRAGIVGGDGRNVGPMTRLALWNLGFRV